MPVSMEEIRRVEIRGSSQGLNKIEGELRKLASSGDAVSLSFEKTSKSTISAQTSYDRLVAKIDPLDRAQQNVARGANVLDRALSQGVITQDQYIKRMEQLRAVNDNVGRGAGLARHELVNLSRQMQDVVVSLYSGQAAATVFLQQGTQVGDVFASSRATLRGFAQQVLEFAARNPFLILAGGVAAVGAAVAAAASYLNNYVKVLDDLSQSTGIAAKELSQLRESAAIKGINNNDFASSMNNFADKIDEAKKGTNELGQLFRLNNKSISDNVTNLYTVADLVKNAADYQDKKNILEAAGLPTTADAVRYYSQGAEELRKQKEAAAGFGEETKKLADNARAFDTAWNTVWESFKTYAVNSIAEVINALKQLTSDPAVQAIMSLLSMTPGEAYAAWKGAVTRTIDRARGYSAGAEAFGLSYPSASSIKPDQQQYGPDIPKITETVKALKEQIRVLQDRNSLLGESATASDKLALAELKIKQAIASGIPLTDQEMKAIRENAVAVKEKAAAHDKVGEALRRAGEGRQEAVEKLESEIRNIFKSTEAMKAEKIALEEVFRLRKAGVPENKIPFADIEDNARIRAELEKQVNIFKQLKDAAKIFATTLIDGLVSGKNLMQSLGDAAKQLGNALVSGGINNIAQGNLLVGGAMVAGGFLANMFGQNQANKQQQQQQVQQLKEAQRVWQEAGPSFTRFINEMTGLGSGGDLSAKFQSVSSNLKQIFKDALAAYDYAAIAQAASASVRYQITQSQQFLATWNSTISGFQSGGGVLKATDAVKSELDRVLAFLDDTRTAMNIMAGSSDFGATPNLANEAGLRWIADGMNAAREAGKSYLLSFVDNKVVMSDVAKQLSEVTATADAVRSALVALNVSAEDAAAAVNDRLASALSGMASAFNAKLTDEINNLSNRGWANDVGDLLKNYQQKLADAALIGGDSSLVTRWFKLSAQNIVNGAELTGDAFNELIKQFPELQGVVTAFASSVEDAVDRIKSYQDQLFIAQQDDQTLSGALAVFDLQAQRGREREVAEGGQALAALEALQAQQRLNIIKDFNDRTLEEQKRTQEQQQQALQQTIEKQKQYIESLRQLKTSLLLGSQSTLSPGEQLRVSAHQFTSVITAAGAGDEIARGQVQEATNAYLEAARAYYGSSTAYANIFNSVQATIDSLIEGAGRGISDADRQYAEMQRQTTLLSSINDALTTSVSAQAVDTSWLASLPQYASGTDFHRGGFAVVGERGPEVINMPRGSRVAPLNDNDPSLSKIAGLLDRLLAVLATGEKMNADESARTTKAVEGLARRLSVVELARKKAS